jgi:membrane peptidoglycan carboxypeptidase
MTGLAAKAGAEGFDNLPSVLQVPQAPQISNVYADDGKTLIATIFNEDRQDVKITEIAPVMLKAIVDSEDTRFYDHHGVDIRGVARALIQGNQDGEQQGASTLTMQYVRQATEYSSTSPQAVIDATATTPERKITEMHLAIALEQQLTKQLGSQHAAKDEILDRYLNIAPFGHGAYGIFAASQIYFGETPSQLTLPQASLLAGLVKAPSTDDPVSEPKLARDRRNDHVLQAMLTAGDITKAEYDQTITLPLGLNVHEAKNGCTQAVNIKWGYFCDYLERWWDNQPAFGADTPTRQNLLESGGFKIVTSLNVADQAAADAAIAGQKGAMQGGRKALLVAGVDPTTGHVTVLAANRTYSNDSSHNASNSDKTKAAAGIKASFPNTTVPLLTDGLNGYQFGSTFKLFTMIAALEDGLPLSYTVNTVTPYTSNDTWHGPNNCDGLYCPTNAASSEHGEKNMWSGFGQSVNTFFVPLEDRMDDGESSGAEKAYNVAKALGIQFPSTYQPGDSFTLGVTPASPLEMAAAYGTIDNNGIYCAPTPVISITDPTGHPLDVANPQCHQAIDSDIAHAALSAARCPVGNQISQCGGGNATAGGVESINAGRPLAGKTGTNDGQKSGSLIEMTPQSVVAGITVDPDLLNPPTVINHGAVNIAVAKTLAATVKGTPKLGFPSPPQSLMNPGNVRIPGFKCSSVGSAESQLSSNGLRYIVMRGQVKSASNCPAGSVERTDPSGSTSRHGVVALYISNGQSAPPSPGASGTPGPPGSGPGGGGPGGGGPGGGGPGGGGGGNGHGNIGPGTGNGGGTGGLICLPDCTPPTTKP